MNEVDVVRQVFGLTQDRQVADLCGVIRQAVSRWRQEDRIPAARRYQLVELARERGLELPDIFFRSQNGASPAPEKPLSYHASSGEVALNDSRRNPTARGKAA